MENIQISDEVILKSGSPALTVVDIDAKNNVTVMYTNDHGELSYTVFKKTSLVLIKKGYIH